MNYALELAQLTKTYAGVKALRGIDLSVEAGDFYALWGQTAPVNPPPSASSSSLVNKTAGSVRVFGYDIDKDIRQRQAPLTTCHRVQLQPFETVLRIVVNGRVTTASRGIEAMARAEKYLNQLDLWGRRNERARSAVKRHGAPDDRPRVDASAEAADPR